MTRAKPKTDRVLCRTIALTLVLFFLALTIALISCGRLAKPDGRYYDACIGSSNPTYWVFKDGKACLREKGAADIPAGSYFRSNGSWVLRGDPSAGDVVLRPTPFGIRMVSAPSTQMNKYLPRQGFAWLTPGKVYDSSSP
jgi:hypothetical protein